MTVEFNTTEELLDDIANGRMVIVLDDEDRENEGDLIMAADHVRPEDINFMARFGRGLICLTLTRETCEQLRLPLMVSGTAVDGSTNFTLSIEAAEGITTGISAHDRARTVAAAVADDARPEDIRQPGHVFPVMAQPGGVLTRAGHTEAGCDLTRLAGCKSAAVIVEILNDDGTMARRPELMAFAKHHGLKIGTIANLISYRLAKEESVERIAEKIVPTEFGDFRLVCYADHVHNGVHLALVRGEIDAQEPTMVRVHVQDTLSDVVGIDWPALGWPLRAAMSRIAAQGSGAVIILRGHDDHRSMLETLLAGPEGRPRPPAPRRGEDNARDLRTYGIGAQILRDLGVRRMRVLSAPKNLHGISGFGLEVVDYLDDEGSE